MLPIVLLAALPLLCGAIPALPAQTQLPRIMENDNFSDDILLGKDTDPMGRPSFAPSEQKAFVLKGHRLLKKHQLPAMVVPKLSTDAKILLDNNWSNKRQQQQLGASFGPPMDSVVPKMAPSSASAMVPGESFFGGTANGEALTNPAAFFLQGANLDRIPAPACHLMGCTGPLANDGDIALEGRTGPNVRGTRQCHQTFVPLNGCWDRAQGPDSYPVGMVCTICCDCSAQLASEMRRSRGWTSGYRVGQ